MPLIYIPEVQSLIWENSCGSGAASIGVFQQYQTNQPCKDFKVKQPGSIVVSSTYSNKRDISHQSKVKFQLSQQD